MSKKTTKKTEKVTVDPVLELYRSLPDGGNFAPQDYKHFNR